MDREPARDRDVVILDVETTGTDPARDQVIELCVQFGLDGAAGPGTSQVWRLRPSCPIHPGAQAVHGISMEDLAGCPGFAEVAREIREVIDGARVLIGYNLAFDIEMLQAEFLRNGGPPVDVSEKQLVDPLRLWQRCEPRSLQAAHRRFVGQEFAAAHSASADVAATGRVLRGMLSHFNLAGDWTEIALVCEPDRSRQARRDQAPTPPAARDPEVAEPDLEAGPEAGPEAESDELDDGPVAQLGGAGEGLGGVGAH